MSLIKPLKRRTFLSGAGSLISLPLLEAMMPSKAFAQASMPKRLLTCYFPFGVYKQCWSPSQYGTNYNLPGNLEALYPYKNRVILTRGIGNYGPSYLGSHLASPPCYTTGLDPAHGGELRVGDISADVKISNFTRSQNPALKQMFMAPDAANYPPGGIFNDYAGAYECKLSWVTTTSSASLTTSPQKVFDALFSGTTAQPANMADPLVQLRQARGKSVLDSVLAQANTLSAKVGASDKAKLDQYFTSIREVEKTITATNPSSNPAPACNPGSRPGSGLPFDQELRAYMDLAVLGFACDKTRVITHFMDVEADVPDRIPTWAGLNGMTHHLYSHWNEHDNGVAMYQQITAWYAQQLAYLLGKMQSFKEADHDLLYNSVIVYGSGMGDGGDHDTYNLPLVIAGELGGTIKSGQGINAPQTPMSNMWLAIMKKFGMSVDKHGDSNGVLNI